MRLERITTAEQMVSGAKVTFAYGYDDGPRTTFQGVLLRTAKHPTWVFICSNCEPLDGGNEEEAEQAGTLYAWSISLGHEDMVEHLKGSDIYGLSLRVYDNPQT